MQLVSVIVPIYNTAKYLEQCILSVVNQTYSDLEIILINDGSNDDSANICSTWKKKDSRIKLINKENTGLADTRNVGIKACSGKWILFLDSDDWYQTTTHIENLVKTAQSFNSQVVCCNYKRYYEKSKRFSNCFVTGSTNTTVKDMVDNQIYTSSACLKLIERDILIKNDIYFPKGILSEDIPFCAKLLAVTDKISYTPGSVYVYRCRENSISTSVSQKHISDIINIIEDMCKTENPTSAYNSYLAFQYCTLLINIHIAKSDKKQKNKVYSYKNLLKYNGGTIVKLVGSVSKIVGIKICSYILYLYFKLVIDKK